MPKKKEYNNPAIKWRQERLQELLSLIKKSKSTNVDRLVAKLSLQYGLSRRKVIEYLRVLETAGKIQVDWYAGTVNSA